MKNILFIYNFYVGMWIYYKYKDYEKAMKYFQKALNNNPNHAKCNFKLGMCFFKKRNWSEAEKFIENAVALNRTITSWQVQLNQSKKHLNNIFSQPQKLWWKEIEDIKKIINKKGGNFLLYKELAIALENMKRYQEAAKNYQLAIDNSNTQDSEIYYRMGFCYETQGNDGESNLELSQKAYKKAIEFDKNLNSDKLGIGIFHENRQYWQEANRAYLQESIKEDNLENDELFYHLARSYEKLYQWKEAEKFYKKTLDINYHRPYTHYRLGLVYERQEKYLEAIEAHSQAIKRNNEHKSFWYYRLGKCYTNIKDFENASKVFVEAQIIQKKPYGLSEDVLKDKNLRRRVFYTECYENLKIQQNTILYESFHGKSMSCNPYAIFLYLLEKEDFKNFTHIWVVNNLNDIKNKFKKMKNIIFVKRGSDLYLKYLASSQYLINNVTFPDYFIRKEEQLYLNTWHGTPWKHLGNKIQTGFMEHANAQRNFLHTTHIIYPNTHTRDIIEKDYDIKEIFSGHSAITGYPRIDLTINGKNITKLKKKLNIESNKKILLYAPTWRGGLNQQYFDVEKLIEDIKKLEETNFKLLLSIHHEIAHLIDKNNIKNYIVPSWLDTNELLTIVDVLITDYSSIAFDYMVLGKPIIYYIFDYKHYKKERGLYFDIEKITQYSCQTIEEVIEILNKEKKLLQNANYKHLKKDFFPLEDGEATKRVVEFFFKQKHENNKNIQNKNILFYTGPFIPNGITNSFKNLVYHLQNLNFNVFVSIDPASIHSHKERLEQFYLISEKVKFLPKIGTLNLTLEEFYIEKESLNEERSLQNYKREFRRLYADAKFKTVVNFEGYNTFWVKLFSSVNDNIIFLHNNMQEEFEKRFPYLEQNFNCYNYYDKIISVSKQTNEENKKNLALKYNIPENKFDYIENTINYQEILEKSQEKLNKNIENNIFQTHSKVFINIARLSIEKDQIKLIKAFYEVHKKYPKTKLIILGEGPLREDLEELIKKLKLTRSVFLLGRIANPFPYLKKADCFVMSSNHEGQPMTLLEALVLKKAIIATSIAGNISVLNGRGGIIVPNSKNGLEIGMKNFILNGQKIQTMDYQFYNQKIVNKFIKLITLNKT